MPKIVPRTLLSAGAMMMLGCPVALAEEPNPAVTACKDKREGQTCERTTFVKDGDGPARRERLPGVCTADECCDLDYSKGSPPQTRCGPCLACKAGPAPSDEPTPQASAMGEPPVVANAAETPPVPTGNEGRGCVIASAEDPAPSWAMLALLSLAALGRPRR